MEGKLIKVENGYVLMVNNIMYATDNDKLSIKNCEAIANGYDLDELAENNYPTFNLPLTDTTAINTLKQDSFKEGFQKAIEILGDKKFSEEDMKKVYLNSSKYEWFGDCIKSLQQTEWDVEIEMKKVKDETKIVGAVKGVKGSGNKITTYKSVPKLDADGCLILRRC